MLCNQIELVCYINNSVGHYTQVGKFIMYLFYFSGNLIIASRSLLYNIVLTFRVILFKRNII